MGFVAANGAQTKQNDKTQGRAGKNAARFIVRVIFCASLLVLALVGLIAYRSTVSLFDHTKAFGRNR